MGNLPTEVEIRGGTEQKTNGETPMEKAAQVSGVEDRRRANHSGKHPDGNGLVPDHEARQQPGPEQSVTANGVK